MIKAKGNLLRSVISMSSFRDVLLSSSYVTSVFCYRISLLKL